MSEKLFKQFQNKWIKVDVMGELNQKNFYISAVLLNDRQNEFTNNGHIFIKYEGSGVWKITDFEIDSQLRGQNFGAAMVLNAMQYIDKLQSEHEFIKQAQKVHGIIGLVFIDDDHEDVRDSEGYFKVRNFYKGLDFEFKDAITFSKDLTNTNLNEWIKFIQSQMEIKQLKLENAVQRQILEQYENQLNHIESKWLGKLLLKTEAK